MENEMTNDAAVAYMTGSWNMRPFVTKMDFGGDETLLHETAKQMHWVPLYSATTVAELRARIAELEAVLGAVVADPTWRTNDNTLWPRLTNALRQEKPE